MVFVEAEAVLRQRPHLQKQILFWSAQRHFAAELKAAGWDVHQLEAASHCEALIPWLKQYGISRLVVMEPPDRPIRQAIDRLAQQRLALPARVDWQQSVPLDSGGIQPLGWQQKATPDGVFLSRDAVASTC